MADNHRIRPATDAEKLYRRNLARIRCSAKFCRDFVDWIAEYDYMPGGDLVEGKPVNLRKTATSRRGYCQGHAEKFAKRYGLDLDLLERDSAGG